MTVSLNGADQRRGAGDLAEEGFVNDALPRAAGKALGKAKELTFDPREEVRSFNDLKRFPLFEDDWLRGGPVRRCRPSATTRRRPPRSASAPAR